MSLAHYDLILPLHGRQASMFIEAALFESPDVFVSPSVFGMSMIRGGDLDSFAKTDHRGRRNQISPSAGRRAIFVLHDWLNPSFEETERPFLNRYGRECDFAFVHREPADNLASCYKTYLFNRVREWFGAYHRLPQERELERINLAEFASRYGYLFELSRQLKFYQSYARTIRHFRFEDVVGKPGAALNAILSIVGASPMDISSFNLGKNTLRFSFFRYYCMHVDMIFNGQRFLMGFGTQRDLRLMRGDLQVFVREMQMDGGGSPVAVFMSYANLYEGNYKDFWMLAADEKRIREHWSSATQFAIDGEVLVDAIWQKEAPLYKDCVRAEWRVDYDALNSQFEML